MSEADEIAAALIARSGKEFLADLCPVNLREFVMQKMPGESVQVIDNVMQAIREAT